MKLIREQGVFWLADDEMNKVAGTLVFDGEEGGSLELVGALGVLSDSLSGIVSHEIIFGIVGSKLVTLLGCTELSRTHRFPGIGQQVFLLQTILIGAHLQSDGLVFVSAEFSFDGGVHWVRESGLSVEPPRQVNPARAQLTVTESPTTRSQLGADTLEHQVRTVLTGDHHEKSEVIQESLFRVVFDKPQTLREVVGIMASVRDLISLSIGHRIPVNGLAVCSPKDEVETNLRIWPRIEVHQSVVGKTGRKPTSRHDFSFTFEDVQGVDGVAAWIRASDQHRSAIALLFASVDDSTPYQELRFLNALIAAEWIDRHFGLNEIEPKKEFKSRKQRILNSLLEEDAEYVKDAVANANEPRLRYRLSRLICDIGEEAETFVGDRTSWSATCSRVRNHIVHRGGQQVNNDLAVPLVYLTYSVFLVAFARLLHEADPNIAWTSKLFHSRRGEWTKSKLSDSVQRAQRIV